MTRNFRSELVGSFSEGSNGNPTVAMIEAAFAHHNLDWRYINCEVTPANLAASRMLAASRLAAGTRLPTARKRHTIPG